MFVMVLDKDGIERYAGRNLVRMEIVGCKVGNSW